MPTYANLREAVASYIEALVAFLGSDRRLSMTAATERIYGTSGRGNPTAKAFIREAADRGVLRIEKRGRAEYVSRGPKAPEPSAEAKRLAAEIDSAKAEDEGWPSTDELYPEEVD